MSGAGAYEALVAELSREAGLTADSFCAEDRSFVIEMVEGFPVSVGFDEESGDVVATACLDGVDASGLPVMMEMLACNAGAASGDAILALAFDAGVACAVSKNPVTELRPETFTDKLLEVSLAAEEWSAHLSAHSGTAEASGEDLAGSDVRV